MRYFAFVHAHRAGPVCKRSGVRRVVYITCLLRFISSFFFCYASESNWNDERTTRDIVRRETEIHRFNIRKNI